MTNREKANRAREALAQIRDYVWQAADGDRNPNKGDLYKISAIAHDALRDTK